MNFETNQVAMNSLCPKQNLCSGLVRLFQHWEICFFSYHLCWKLIIKMPTSLLVKEVANPKLVFVCQLLKLQALCILVRCANLFVILYKILVTLHRTLIFSVVFMLVGGNVSSLIISYVESISMNLCIQQRHAFAQWLIGPM